MNATQLINRLEAFPRMLAAVCADVSDEDALYRSDGQSWSILEVVCHLTDEEAADFPARLESLLRDPEAPWPSIDPEGWARERGYRDRELSAELQRFAAARAARVAWLRALEAPDWSKAHAHPTVGPIRAGDLLAAWCDHDILHLRQVVKRLHQLVQRDAGDYSTSYAGVWTA